MELVTPFPYSFVEQIGNENALRQRRAVISIRVEDVRLERREIGGKHVITSPDVPELHVAHADAQMALASVQPTLDTLAKMRERVAERKRVDDRKRERAVA